MAAFAAAALGIGLGGIAPVAAALSFASGAALWRSLRRGLERRHLFHQDAVAVGGLLHRGLQVVDVHAHLADGLAHRLDVGEAAQDLALQVGDLLLDCG